MPKRMEKIKKIQKAIRKLLDGNKDLINVMNVLEDKELKTIINHFTFLYAILNFKLSTYLLYEFPKYYNKDIIDKDFNKLMQPLADELRKRKDNNGKK